MKPEIKELWMNALPNYEQTTGALRIGDRFCCLGVLCDIYMKETGNLSWERTEDDKSHEYYIHGYNIGYESYYLPYEVWGWAGLNCSTPYFIDPNHPVKDDNDTVLLSNLNDIGYDFKQIAELIQKHF
jgi:hypothetical protein